MNYIGISNKFHDAALSVVDDKGNILFAGHSERYSKVKHDSELCTDLAKDAKQYCNDINYKIHYYERPFVTQLRQLRAGQKIDFNTAKGRIGKDILRLFNNPSITTHNHHLSHAAAGFQTSPFLDATVVVVDAIGEFDTISIWHAEYNDKGIAQYKKLYSQQYPHSIGLFYSAMTEKVGLKPLDEEYILMGMAAYGTPRYQDDMLKLIHSLKDIEFSTNLHIGLDSNFLNNAYDMDVASSAQEIVESLLRIIMSKAKNLSKSNNLVYGGGVALNCLANRMLGEYFDNIWIMPNPGDAGSSLGAAALGYGKRLHWYNAYLGKNIPGKYPVNDILSLLQTDKIVGVASGRAEFGPRALGNRSLLADPRGPEIKDKVNEIKRRQKFRPFAPVILEEYVDKYFTMPKNWQNSRYMQVIAKCNYPDIYPAIIHADGTSRVQTVPKDGSGIRELLEKWYVLTECPMLLNTSLNIRGEPMVNDRIDADRFETQYNLRVCS